MSRYVESFIAAVAKTLDGDEERAIVAVSALVGALTLSRVVADPARSDAILKVVRDHLIAFESDACAMSTTTCRRVGGA